MRLLSEKWPYLMPEMERFTLLAYLLWAFWGFLGLHKLYLGKPVMALLYLFTGGIFGVGWLADGVTLPHQVDWFHVKKQLAEGRDLIGKTDNQSNRPGKVLRRPSDIMMALLGFARDHRGIVTVTAGVMVTGASFKKVESVLREMATSGYVDVTNDRESGTVQYVFHEFTGGTPSRRSDLS